MNTNRLITLHLLPHYTLGSGLNAHGPAYTLIMLVLLKGRWCLLLSIPTLSGSMYVAVVTSAISSITIEKLRGMFATHWIPEIVVYDNGTVFTSDKFETFMTSNGIRHIKSAPHHPSANGLTEYAIQTLKENLKKSKTGPLKTKIFCFLFKYCTMLHTITGISPAEFLMGTQLC